LLSQPGQAVARCLRGLNAGITIVCLVALPILEGTLRSVGPVNRGTLGRKVNRHVDLLCRQQTLPALDDLRIARW